MLYHQGNHNRRGLEGKNTTLIVIIVISVFVLLVTPVRNTITQAVYRVAPSIWSIGDSSVNFLNSIVVNFSDKNTLTKENRALVAENDRMQVLVLDRNLLAEKIAVLEASLGRARIDNRVSANVIAGPGLTLYDTLVLDVGSDNGVAVGDMVAYVGSGVIGEIAEVAGVTSKAELYSSPGKKVSATVGVPSIPIVASGNGMGNFEAKVPQDSHVVVGDIVTSMKGGFILGTVSQIEEKPAEPFKRIFFREPFNITEIESVEIILGNRP